MSKKSKSDRIGRTLAILVAVLLLLIAVCLNPVVFENLFAIDYLLNHEISSLKTAFIALLGAAVFIFLFRRFINLKLSLALFGLSLLMFIELGFRAVAHFTFSGGEKWELEKDGLRTYPDYTAYAGHPFLQFTKRPLRDASTNDFKNPYEFNSFGFKDSERSYEKPEGVYRIACLGGSTTERGYPLVLNSILDSSWSSSTKPEVLSFGVSSWTSAHSMINYLLNVVAFEPDMIIIHHGWNESEVRNSPEGEFRPDYSHAFTYFHEPERKDGLIVRTSLLYRYIKAKLDLREGWMYLDRATMKRDREYSDANFSDTTELRVYKRNLKTIINQALMNGTEVVLTTMPYNTDILDKSMNMQQCNLISRKLKQQYGEKIILVDLDKLMTGKDNSIFIDVGHVTDEGKKIKSEHLANAILTALQVTEPDVEVTLEP